MNDAADGCPEWVYWKASEEKITRLLSQTVKPQKIVQPKRVLRKLERDVLFSQFLQCIDREEDLINARLAWAININVAITGALFLVLLAKEREVIHWIIICVLFLFGVFVNVQARIAVLAAHKQSMYLINQLNLKLFGKADVGSEQWESSNFIRPYGELKGVHWPARNYSAILPYVFPVCWIVTISAVFLFGGSDQGVISDSGCYTIQF
jgi:hypothetical protein